MQWIYSPVVEQLEHTDRWMESDVLLTFSCWPRVTSSEWIFYTLINTLLIGQDIIICYFYWYSL